LSSRKSPWTIDTCESSRALAGMCVGSHSMRRSIASIGSVIDARYCLVQRPIWRSK
jgi:hypothetical protein